MSLPPPPINEIMCSFQELHVLSRKFIVQEISVEKKKSSQEWIMEKVFMQKFINYLGSQTNFFEGYDLFIPNDEPNPFTQEILQSLANHVIDDSHYFDKSIEDQIARRFIMYSGSYTNYCKLVKELYTIDIGLNNHYHNLKMYTLYALITFFKKKKAINWEELWNIDFDYVPTMLFNIINPNFVLKSLLYF